MESFVWNFTCVDDDDDEEESCPTTVSVTSLPASGASSPFTLGMKSSLQSNIERAPLTDNSAKPTSIQRGQLVRKQKTIAEPPDSNIIATVIRHCLNILFCAAEHKLRAVELANAARSRVGVAALASIREYMGGLLNVLDAYPTLFVVYRIPKNDVIMLTQYAFNQMFLHSETFFTMPGSTATQPNATSDSESHQFEFDPSSLSSSSSASSAAASTTNSAAASLWNSPIPSPRTSLPSLPSSISLPATPTYNKMNAHLSTPMAVLLSRLSDDSYVPTMVWQKSESDVALRNLICSFIYHFRSSIAGAGSSSCHITRLRKVIRHHFQLTENIKTVALKAFLTAYSNIFTQSAHHHVSLTYEGIMLGTQVSTQISLPLIELEATPDVTTPTSKLVEVHSYPPIELGKAQTVKNTTYLHIFGENPLFPDVQKTSIIEK